MAARFKNLPPSDGPLTSYIGWYLYGMPNTSLGGDKYQQKISVARAMCLYAIDTGRYASTIEELVPRYLARVPDSLVEGAELKLQWRTTIRPLNNGETEKTKEVMGIYSEPVTLHPDGTVEVPRDGNMPVPVQLPPLER